MQCPQCRADNDASLRFCESCGANLARLCRSCGHELKPQAKFCGQCGASLSEPAAPPLAPAPAAPPDLVPAAPGPAEIGERRQLTILFSDLVGSTELSTQLDPEEWRDCVAQYHLATADAVTRFGGSVAKYLGDGVLALFGFPLAHEDDAERAVRAGLGIVDEVRGLSVGGRVSGSSNTPHPTPNTLSVRIGIHTGLTVIGDAGGKPDVFGETPNVAARVHGAAEPDTVLVSAATQRLVAGLFVVEDRGTGPRV